MGVGKLQQERRYALIAATAIANGIPVYTCNAGDFTGIEGLRVVEVPLPSQ